MIAATIFQLISLLVLFVGLPALQFYLSKRESQWPGLILPIMCFLFSLIFPLNMASPAGIGQILLVWLMANIPTILFLAIYFGCREKMRRKRQIDKMNIQDLA